MVRTKKSFQGIRLFTLSVAALGLFAVAACSSDDGGTTTTTGTALEGLASCTAQAGSSVICGKVVAADGTTPVVGAEVTQADGSSLVAAPLTGLSNDAFGALTADPDKCLTDDLGDYACLVPGSGEFNLLLSGSIFGNTPQAFTATGTEGETTTVDVTADVSAQWLVVPGSFDGIQLLLAELKGCTLTGDASNPDGLRGSEDCENKGLKVLDDAEVTDFLADEDLSVYQAIFANCDADESFSARADEVTTALRNYVNGGKNMYFSDLSDSWLTTVFPDNITFPADKNSTGSGTLSGATVKDTGLQMFLGSTASPQTSMDIIFDLGVWTAMESVRSGWTTFIEGDIAGSGLGASHTGTRPITVGGPQEDGCVFYTSYHVEPSSVTGAEDQEKALRYLILNRMNNCS